MMPRSAERTTRKTAAAKKKDPFRLGFRYGYRVNENGRVEQVQIPLTLKDVLHPQLGDVIVESINHQLSRDYLARIIRPRLSRLNNGIVMADCLINWGVEGMGNHAPDVAAFEGLQGEADFDAGTFFVAKYGRPRCIMIVEVSSPDTRLNNVEAKFDHYHQLGVRLYVIADKKGSDVPREIYGYRWTRARWVPVRLDRHGRVPVKALGISIGVAGGRVWAYDLETRRRIPEPEEMEQELETTKTTVEELREQNEYAEERIRQLEAELQRLRDQAAK